MKSIKLSGVIPQEQPADALIVDGFEPWNMEDVLVAQGISTENNKWLEAGKTLRDKGHQALSAEARAFWLSYLTAAKAPMPNVTQDVTDVDDATIKAIIKAFKAAKPDMEAYKEGVEKAEMSEVFRHHGYIGLFANKGPLRIVTLPDWCRAGIIVNTKAKTWEIFMSGSYIHGLPNLLLLMDYTRKESGQTWTGNRFRIRANGLPDVRTTHYAMQTLHAVMSAKS